jgi:hypothetical protein
MHHHIVYGIDPGLVHTGVVGLAFDPTKRELQVRPTVVPGADATTMTNSLGERLGWVRHVFIEGYKPRSHYDTDNRMVTAVSEIHKKIPGSKVLLNHGVKKIIRKPLMDLLEVWNFNTPTHHQDLRAAARIALLGMVKDDTLNACLTQVVTDYLDGRRWDVLH